MCSIKILVLTAAASLMLLLNSCNKTDYESEKVTQIIEEPEIIYSTTSCEFTISVTEIDGITTCEIITENGANGIWEWYVDDVLIPSSTITGGLIWNDSYETICATMYSLEGCDDVPLTECYSSNNNTLALVITSCDNEGFGAGIDEVSVTVTGGTPPYTFEWFNDDETLIGTSQSVPNLANEIYTVFVTDFEGYTANSSTATGNPVGEEITLTFPSNMVAESTQIWVTTEPQFLSGPCSLIVDNEDVEATYILPLGTTSFSVSVTYLCGDGQILEDLLSTNEFYTSEGSVGGGFWLYIGISPC
ncbi:MAG: hypothetical protein P8L71_07455 [Flavobacteriales bacterium]|nr:hypothetical protein [Flavobacteriales bacterium]